MIKKKTLSVIKDVKMCEALNALYDYLESTYSDKYPASEVDLTKLRFSDNLGKGFNIGNAAKYLQRYATTGYAKSETKLDLFKAIHYILFEIQRKNDRA